MARTAFPPKPCTFTRPSSHQPLAFALPSLPFGVSIEQSSHCGEGDLYGRTDQSTITLSRDLVSTRSQEVANAFNRYVSKSDKSLVEKFTKDEIEMALIECSADKGFSHYEAMERRLQTLKEVEAKSLSRKERWKERFIGSVLAILVGLIIWLITGLLGS